MPVYLVKCPCCEPRKWHVFSNREDAIGHAKDRSEYHQQVFEVVLDNCILDTYELDEAERHSDSHGLSGNGDEA